MNVHSWLNALHIIAAIIWIGGIFVMATAAAWCAQAVGKNAPTATALAAFVRNWSRKVTTPTMIVLWVMGLAMVLAHGQMPHLWLILKLVLVVLLSGIHGMLSATLRRLAGGEITKVPGMVPRATTIVIVAVAVIILLVVFRPF